MSDATLSAPVWEGDRAPLAKAFVAAQKATEAVKKANTNPAFKSKYADLAAVVEAVVPALNEAGVGVMQFPSFDGELVGVTTTLLHEGGSSVTATLHLRPSKLDAQGVGSAITYGRRYSLLAITGGAPEDDDGAAASGPRQTGVPIRKDYGPAPTGDDFPGVEDAPRKSSYAAKKDGSDKRFNEIKAEIESLGTMSEVGLFTKARTEEIKGFPETWRKVLREALDEQRRFIVDSQPPDDADDFRDPVESRASGVSSVPRDADHMETT